MSTYTLYGELRFPRHKGRQAFLVRRFESCKIESSWKNLTDTAEFTIPRKVKDFDRNGVSEWFREGDPVEIWLGYDGVDNLVKEFQGYIKQVPAGIPLVITCEDEMYKLKRRTVSISKKDCELKELLEEIAPDYTVVCDEGVKLGNVRYSKMTAGQVLEALQDNGIYSWFVGGELHAYEVSRSDIDPVRILLERTVSEGLKQKEIEKTIVALSLIRRKGKRTNVEYGDDQAGKRIKKEISGIEMSEAELRAEAKRMYELATTPGLDGDITLFGLPRLQHGMIVDMYSELYKEKNGKYYVDSITKTFDKNGYRQVCKLGMQAI